MGLKISPTDWLIRNFTSFAKNKMGHQIGRLLPLYARKHRRILGGGRFYKSRERLKYDVIQNRFGKSITLDRAIEIANFNKL